MSHKYISKLVSWQDKTCDKDEYMNVGKYCKLLLKLSTYEPKSRLEFNQLVHEAAFFGDN